MASPIFKAATPFSIFSLIKFRVVNLDELQRFPGLSGRFLKAEISLGDCITTWSMQDCTVRITISLKINRFGLSANLPPLITKSVFPLIFGGGTASLERHFHNIEWCERMVANFRPITRYCLRITFCYRSNKLAGLEIKPRYAAIIFFVRIGKTENL